VLFLLPATEREFISYVILVLVLPILAGVGVGESGGLPLEEFLMGRIGERRVDYLGRAIVSALDEMAGAEAILANGGDMFVAFHGTTDGHITILAGFGSQREEMQRQFLECLALLFVGRFVN